MIAGTVLMVPGIISTVSLVGLAGFHLQTILRAGLEHPLLILLLGLSVIGAGIFAIGMVSYVVVGSLSHERAELGYGSVGTILACLGTAIVAANLLTLPYFLSVGEREPGQPLVTPIALFLSVVVLDGALLVIVYFRIVHPKVLSWHDLGLTRVELGERVAQGFGLGVLVIVATALVEAALRSVGIQQTQEQMFEGVRSASLGQFFLVLIAGAVIAPIIEEIFFRGYVFTAACRTYGVIPAFILSALLFSLAHLNLQALIPILLIAVLFCFAYWKTGSLVPSIIAHMMNNALALISLYFVQR